MTPIPHTDTKLSLSPRADAHARTRRPGDGGTSTHCTHTHTNSLPQRRIPSPSTTVTSGQIREQALRQAKHSVRLNSRVCLSDRSLCCGGTCATPLAAAAVTTTGCSVSQTPMMHGRGPPAASWSTKRELRKREERRTNEAAPSIAKCTSRRGAAETRRGVAQVWQPPRNRCEVKGRPCGRLIAAVASPSRRRLNANGFISMVSCRRLHADGGEQLVAQFGGVLGPALALKLPSEASDHA